METVKQNADAIQNNDNKQDGVGDNQSQKFDFSNERIINKRVSISESPALLRKTSQRKVSRGWSILKKATLEQLQGKVNYALETEENVYNV